MLKLPQGKYSLYMWQNFMDSILQETPRKKTTRDGLGLIEVMISLTIFAASITGMCGLALICRDSSDRARDHYIAVNLAKNRLERAKSLGFGQLSTFAENMVLVNSQGRPSGILDFRRTTIVSNVTASLTEVRVTVEIRNRETWSYVPGVEDIRSYVSSLSGGS